MIRWEYKMVLSNTTMFFANIRAEDITVTLNQHGNEGWEVTGIIEAAVGNGTTNQIGILLKRPLLDGTLQRT